jgi:hypothetical protein
MRRWKPASHYCRSKQLQEIEGGMGGMSVTFDTDQHVTPRNFYVFPGFRQNSRFMKNLKQLHKFYEDTFVPYHKAIMAYRDRKVPGLTSRNILSESNIFPAALSLRQTSPRVPVGTVTRDYTAVRDGFASFEKTTKAWARAGEIQTCITVGAELYGPYPSFSNALNAAAGAQVSAIATHFAQKHVMKVFNSMVGMMAEVNKNFADQGDPEALKAQKRVVRPLSDGRKVYTSIDADYMAWLLQKTFEFAEELEKLYEDDEGVPSISGYIWGPDLWDGVRPNSRLRGSTVGVSFANSEYQTRHSPEVVAALRKAGYRIPDLPKGGIPDVKLPEGLKVDLKKPGFYGNLLGVRPWESPKIKNAPSLYVSFSVGSLEKSIKTDFDLPTIFDDLPVEEPQPSQCSYYVAANGSDSGTGSAESPFATLQHALNKARDCRAEGKITEIVLRDGTYRQSAAVAWRDLPSTPLLTVRAENPNGAVLSATDIVNAQWQAVASGWEATLNLSSTNPPPVVVVNGQKLTYVPAAGNLSVSGTYKIQGNKVIILPPAGVRDLNSATVEIGTRPFALRMTGA